MNFLEAVRKAQELGSQGVVVKRPHHDGNLMITFNKSTDGQFVISHNEPSRTVRLTVTSCLADDWEVIDCNNRTWINFFTLEASKLIHKKTLFAREFKTPLDAMIYAIKVTETNDNALDDLLTNVK